MTNEPNTVAEWWYHYSQMSIPPDASEGIKTVLKQAFYYGFGTGVSQLQRTFNEGKDSRDVIDKVEKLHAECASPFPQQH